MACTNSAKKKTILSRSCKTTAESEITEEVFNHIMSGEWEKAVELHRTEPAAFEAKIISSSDDTALHLAIAEERVGIVEELVGLLRRTRQPPEVLRILGLRNDKRRTPLHVAAATGNRHLCQVLAGGERSLVLERDYNGETPLFRAARYGRVQAFMYLHALVFKKDEDESDRQYCWDNHDHTILHIAISRENFDLAYQIIHLYPELVNLVDKEGASPLHALARKPAAFPSGTTIHGRNRIIYKCLSVNVLKVIKSEPDNSDKKQTPEVSDTMNHNASQQKRAYFNNFRGHAKKEVDIESSTTEEYDISGKGSIDDYIAQELPSPGQYMKRNRFVELMCSTIIPFLLGFGRNSVHKIKAQKKKHVWSAQVLDALLECAVLCDGKEGLRASDLKKKPSPEISDVTIQEDSRDHIQDSGERIYEISKIGSGHEVNPESARKEGIRKQESAILIAAKHGVVEIIKKIINGHFPMAVYDKGEESKNVMLVALQNRHVEVYKFLLKKYNRDHIVFQKIDDHGNTALHYAAMYDPNTVRSWPVPGAALQMQWEIKWHEYVEDTMPSRMCSRTNKEGQTPKELFSQTHKGLVKEGGGWLISTATSCSVVATLIATVAFASSTTAPGGTVNGKNPTFELFAILSLVSLCFSVTSLLMFLAILTSRHQEKDFGKALPRKILAGLTSLFVAIASMLVTFCAGHFLIFEDKIKYAVLPIYAVTLLPLCFFAGAQFPLYFDLLVATFWSPF